MPTLGAGPEVKVGCPPADEAHSRIASVTEIARIARLADCTGWIAMVYRIIAEERVLARDVGRVSYHTMVRYRLVPGLW